MVYVWTLPWTKFCLGAVKRKCSEGSMYFHGSNFITERKYVCRKKTNAIWTYLCFNTTWFLVKTVQCSPNDWWSKCDGTRIFPFGINVPIQFSFQNELVFWCLMSIFLAVCFLIDLLSVISKIFLFDNWCFHAIFEFFKLQSSFHLIWWTGDCVSKSSAFATTLLSYCHL